jgi:glutathione S-transferase
MCRCGRHPIGRGTKGTIGFSLASLLVLDGFGTMAYSHGMPELILHHYDISPFAEKVRLIMGLKGLSWRSVQIPIIMPKPDLVALTGGYRLTPVLQIGADVYCDTKVIARRLEEEKRTPTLYPSGYAAIERSLSFWGETLFIDIVTIGAGLEIFPADFVEDRARMVPGGFDVGLAKLIMPSKFDDLRAKLDLIERQLSDGRPFLLGDAPSLADLSVYHPIWALRTIPDAGILLDGLSQIPPWMEQVAKLGHGGRSEMESSEAIEIARRATPTTKPGIAAGDPNGRHPGDRVQVFPEAYGRDPVRGELVFADAHQIAIRRHDERVGEVVVHFPHEGYVTLANG